MTTTTCIPNDPASRIVGPFVSLPTLDRHGFYTGYNLNDPVKSALDRHPDRSSALVSERSGELF